MQYENLPTTVEVQSEKLMDRNGQNALVPIYYGQVFL
jgi:hypothetical protein